VTTIKGLDTIAGLVGEPPPEIPVKYRTMCDQQVLISDWNASYIAIIPYCFKCKIPLDWYRPPSNDELFVCPNCGRVWVRGEGWPTHDDIKKEVSEAYDEWKEETT